MHLFKRGDFTLHSGVRSQFKIDCDALTDDDWQTLACLIASRFVFGAVEGVPRGGLQLAAALQPYCTKSHSQLLIVDDVLTTGASMFNHRGTRFDAQGVVVFARGQCPDWVHALWQWGL